MPHATTPLPPARAAVVISLASLIILTLGCANIRPPKPRAAYQADVAIHVVNEDGSRRSLGRLVEFYSTGKRRRETRISGQAVALIDRPDLAVSWRLDLEKDSFEEFPISSREAMLASIPNPFGPRGGEFSWVGREELNGVLANHYRVRGVGLWGDAWFTSEQVPLLFEGQLGEPGRSIRIRINYDGIMLGTVDPDLFVIPAYYAGYHERTKSGDRNTPPDDDQMQKLNDERRNIPDLPSTLF